MAARRNRTAAAPQRRQAGSSELVRRVAVYTRRSTDEEHQPYSIEAQTLRLETYIASQPGWVKVASFSDNASAKDTRRPGLTAALAAARSGRIDVLLVLKVDRFSRRQRDLVSLVEELTSLNVAFVSATEAFDTSTPAGRAMLQMLGTFAEFEREMIIDRVVAGMERHAAAGRWPGGVRPDGYILDRDTKRLVVDEDRATIVREIFDLYTAKRLGTRAIANQLNARGSRTRTGGPWSAHTIRWLLTNPAYLGQVTFRDTTVEGAHPAIVDPATFTTAERVLHARGEARTHRAASSSDYHLTGLIRCPHCKKGFIGTAAHGRSKVYRYYTCWSRARYGTTTCNADRINADAADQALFANLAAFYRDQRDLIAAAATQADTARHAATNRHRTELTGMEKEITRTGTAIDRYRTAFENNTLDPALLQDRLKALRAKTAQLEARRDELTQLLDHTPAMPTDDQLDTMADHIDQILDHGTPAQRKALIEQLVDHIQIVGPGRIRPIYRIPRQTEDAKPAADDATVRTIGNLVDLLRRYSNHVFPPVLLGGERITSGPKRVVRPPRRVRRRLTSNQIEQLRADYRAGATTRDLARQYEVGKTAITRLLREQGIPLRHQGLSAEQRAEASRLYEAGNSVAQVATALGFHPSSIYDALIRAGVTMRPAHEPGRRLHRQSSGPQDDARDSLQQIDDEGSGPPA